MLVEQKQGRGLRIKRLTVALIATALIALLTANPLEANGSSTMLALEPELVRVPHLDLEQGLGRFYIDLHLSNVQDLTWFKFIIVFDGDVLETVPDGWYGDPSSWSGGGTSSGNSGDGSYTVSYYETGPLSGSGILLSYWFKTRAAGTTKIEFREAELRDSNGDVIPCTFIGNEVEVLPFDTWLNGEYEKLSMQYDELQTQYTDLEAKHGTLSGEYGSLNSNYISLQEDYAALKSSYSSLEEDYASLSAEHAVLEADYLSLEVEHQSTVEQVETAKSQLSTTQILLYVFIGATAVLLCVMIFLLLRRRGLGN
jgi:hypothetical protein